MELTFQRRSFSAAPVYAVSTLGWWSHASRHQIVNLPADEPRGDAAVPLGLKGRDVVEMDNDGSYLKAPHTG